MSLPDRRSESIVVGVQWNSATTPESRLSVSPGLWTGLIKHDFIVLRSIYCIYEAIQTCIMRCVVWHLSFPTLSHVIKLLVNWKFWKKSQSSNITWILVKWLLYILWLRYCESVHSVILVSHGALVSVKVLARICLALLCHLVSKSSLLGYLQSSELCPWTLHSSVTEYYAIFVSDLSTPTTIALLDTYILLFQWGILLCSPWLGTRVLTEERSNRSLM